jgi:hypothetical protein
VHSRRSFPSAFGSGVAGRVKTSGRDPRPFLRADCFLVTQNPLVATVNLELGGRIPSQFAQYRVANRGSQTGVAAGDVDPAPKYFVRGTAKMTLKNS